VTATRASDRGVRIEGPPSAPVLILANSLGTSAAMWDLQVPVLRQRFRVVSYEHRGHGGTSTPAGPYAIADLGEDLLAVLDESGARRASLMGLSLGGMVAMWLAAHHPDRVDRLVLACTAPQIPPKDMWTERAAQVRAEGTGSLLEMLLARWFSAGFLDRQPEMAAEVATMLDKTSPDGYAGCCEAIGPMDQWADLGGISAPTLVIAGANDPATPPEVAFRMQQAIPGAALTVLAGAAHLANIEQPARFTAAAVAHLTGVDVERGDATRRAVLGDDYVDGTESGATGFAAPFTEFITRYAWGDLWNRPGLDRRTRSAITLALLTSLGKNDELALHVAGARRNGLTEEEIGEVLLHTAVYAGVPAARAAFAVADEVLREGADG